MAMKMFDKMMKKGKEVKDPLEKEALEGLFGDLRDSARSAMKGGLDKVGKVKAVVASDSKEGLKKGLDKAKDIVEKVPPQIHDEMLDEAGDESMEDSKEEVEGSESDDAMEQECKKMSPEKLESMIKKLQDMKKEKIGY